MKENNIKRGSSSQAILQWSCGCDCPSSFLSVSKISPGNKRFRWSVHAFSDVSLKKLMNKQWMCELFATPCRSFDITVMTYYQVVEAKLKLHKCVWKYCVKHDMRNVIGAYFVLLLTVYNFSAPLFSFSTQICLYCGPTTLYLAPTSCTWFLYLMT